jgi:hypothetical protein
LCIWVYLLRACCGGLYLQEEFLAQLSIRTFENRDRYRKHFMKKISFVLVSILCFIGINSRAQQMESDFQMSSMGSFFYSINNPTGNLGNYLPSYGCIGYGFEISYKNFLVDFNQFESELNELKNDFNFKGTWNKNTPTKLKYSEALIGLSAINNDLFKLNLLVGASQPKIKASYSYIEENKQYADMSIYSRFTPEVGISFDGYYSNDDYIIRWDRRKVYNFYYHFRFRLVYQFSNYRSEINDLSGGSYAVQVAIGVTARYLRSHKRHR